MAVQGLGYTCAAGAEAEHCNGDSAMGQGAAVPGLDSGPATAMGDRARQRELGGGGGGGGGGGVLL